MGSMALCPNGALAISLRDGDKTLSQLAFAAVLQQPLRIAVLFGSWMYCRGSTGHIVGTGRIVTLWYAAVCRIDVTTATQLLINTTRFSLPRDIGTPRHWVETPGHWNLGTLEPQVHREEKGQRPENWEWAPTRGTVFSFF